MNNTLNYFERNKYLIINTLAISFALCLFFFPEIALAATDNPIKKGADSFLGWLNDSLVPIGTIIIIFAALGAWRTLWGWDKFWWALAIVFILFFAPKLVLTMKEWAT